MTESDSDALDKQQLRELLPFHASQTLDATQTAQVQSALQRYPDLRHELAWLQGMRKTIKDQPLDPLPGGDLGWSALARRIATQRGHKVGHPVPINSGWSEKVRTWLQLNYLPVMVGTCAVLLAQVVVIAALVQQDTSYVAAGAPEPTIGTARGVLLHVSIRPTVTQTQLHETLRQYKANIVQGPTALGIYTLQIEPVRGGDTEPASPTDLAQRLQREATPVFETVTPAAER